MVVIEQEVVVKDSMIEIISEAKEVDMKVKATAVVLDKIEESNTTTILEVIKSIQNQTAEVMLHKILLKTEATDRYTL